MAHHSVIHWGIRLRAATGAVMLGVAMAACSEVTDHSAEQGPTPSVDGSVWVANEAGNSLTVIDAASNAVVTTLTGVMKPHNVQVGRGGATVYAVSSSDNLVVAIDPATYMVEAIAPTGPVPAHVIEAPNGKVYVSNSGDGSVSVYQGAQLRPTGSITLTGMPHGMRAANDGSVIVVANTTAGALDVIDPAADRSSGTVHIGAGPAQVAVTANGRYAYAGINEPSAVVKVDLEARTVVATTPVPSAPVQLYLTADERTLVSADQGTRDKPGHTASLIDTATMTVHDTIATGSGPHGVVTDTTGTRAWVTNSYDGTISVIDLPNSSATATIQTGAEPTGISYSPGEPAIANSPTITLAIPAAPTSSEVSPPSNQHNH